MTAIGAEFRLNLQGAAVLTSPGLHDRRILHTTIGAELGCNVGAATGTIPGCSSNNRCGLGATTFGAE